MIFYIFQKIRSWGIRGPPYCGISATIRIGQEMLCILYSGFFKSTLDVAHDLQHVTCNMWCFEEFEEKEDRRNELMNYEGVCRTAPAKYCRLKKYMVKYKVSLG